MQQINFWKGILGLLKEAYSFLLNVSKSRFGSAVIGFFIAAGVSYFGFIQKSKKDYDFLAKQKDTISWKLTDCQIQKGEAFEKGRKVGMAESEKYIEAAHNLIQRANENLANKNLKDAKEIERMQKELEIKKEVIR